MNSDGPLYRLPYAALQSEGMDPCVIGPRDEIVVEIGDYGSDHDRLVLASRIAAMVNDQDENYVCSDRARRDKAKHFLLLVRQNHIRDNETMETLSLAIEEAGVAFCRAEIAELTGGNIPF